MHIDISSSAMPPKTRLALVIGLPGSGKTTTAEYIESEYGFVHISADQYWIDKETGEYNFDEERMKEAHDWCVKETKRLLSEGYNVVVANTFHLRKYRKKYYKLGVVTAVHHCTDYYESKHNVPDEVLQRMYAKWEPYNLEEQYSLKDVKRPTKIDHRHNFPISILNPDYKNGYYSPVFFDQSLKIIEPFTDYCLAITKMNVRFKDRFQQHKSEIDAVTGALKSFAEYLKEKRIAWQDVNTMILIDFRDWEYKRVRLNKSSKSDRTAKDTVNMRLKHIYQFYYWAEYKKYLIEGRISEDVTAPIRSSLPLREKGVKLNTSSQYNFLYPASFNRTGATGRVSNGYIATQKDIDDLKEFFRKSSDPYLVSRNLLVTDYVAAVGFRAASMHSLTADQFTDELVYDEKLKDKFPVKPTSQKRGYGFTFDIPIELAIRINAHIKHERREFLDNKKSKLKEGEEYTEPSAVFLSSKARIPKALELDSLKAVFQTGFKEIGAPRDSGLHSIRGFFATNETRIEFEARKRAGLPVGLEDTMYPLAKKLGQLNGLSPEFYQETTRHLTDDAPEKQLQKQVFELQAENAAQAVEIAKLREIVNQRSD